MKRTNCLLFLQELYPRLELHIDIIENKALLAELNSAMSTKTSISGNMFSVEEKEVYSNLIKRIVDNAVVHKLINEETI